MRIATWNVNSIKARGEYVLDYFDTRRPGIVCLQELKVDNDAFPFDAFAERGYETAVCAQPTWNGVAVVSKMPLRLRQAGLPGHEDDGARLVTADVTTDSGDISVTSVYVPNGKTVEHADYEMKLAWLDSLHDYAKGLMAESDAVIIAGDYNLVPADIDSYHAADAEGTIFHTDAERDRYKRMLGLGLVDVFRNAAPDEPGFSWWDYRGGSFHQNKGLRIDFILATEAVAGRATSVAIDRTFRKKRADLPDVKPSDHAPVEATLSETNRV